MAIIIVIVIYTLEIDVETQGITGDYYHSTRTRQKKESTRPRRCPEIKKVPPRITVHPMHKPDARTAPI